MCKSLGVMKAQARVRTVSFKSVSNHMLLIELVAGSKTMCGFSNPQGLALYCRGMVCALVTRLLLL